MTTLPPLTAIVPMRHYSERVPQKNYRSFASRPLFHHILSSLLQCPEITQVVVDTDSELIEKQIGQNFSGVRVLQRPQSLRDGSIPMNEVLANTIRQLDGEHFLQTHSTNPLLKPATISRAVQQYFAGLARHDSLFSVTPLQTRLWKKDAVPLNHDPAVLLRTQDLETLYEENSNIYIFQRAIFAQNNNRIGHKPMMFAMDKIEAMDIDDEADFSLAEHIFLSRNQP